MRLQYQGKIIRGVLTIIPQHESRFEDEASNYDFTESQRTQLKSIMGYNTHRIVQRDEICVSDMCLFGMDYLFEKNLLNRDEIDALILVTQTPDYLVPPTSSVIHGKAGLKSNVFCMDINQGCTGFIVGLMQAFMLLEQESIKKVLLLNADILSRKVSNRDKNSYPLIGDAASVTVVEKGPLDLVIHANLANDGTRYDTMIIPAGGLRLPSSPTTSGLEPDEKGSLRSKNHLVTKGDLLFNFVQTEVPPMVNELLSVAGQKIEDVDYFMFHQPNKFTLQKLASKLKIDPNRLPHNVVENLGNPGSVSIPAVITYNCSPLLTSEIKNFCLAGFGVGLSWASMLLKMGPLDFCEMLEMP